MKKTMIDGIRLCIKGDNTKWYQEVMSQGYVSTLNEKTGEISATKTLEYRRNLKVEVRNSNVIIIKGSVHKAFNNGANYNDFGFSDFVATTHTMSKELKLDITKAKVDSFEFGVNLTNLPFPSDVAISRIVNYKGRPKQTISTIGNEYVNQRYNLKIYSKSNSMGCCKTHYVLK